MSVNCAQRIAHKNCAELRPPRANPRVLLHHAPIGPPVVGAVLAALAPRGRRGRLLLHHHHHRRRRLRLTTISSTSLQASLGLDLPELEATVRALKRYGNSSSASFLFAFGELLDHPPATIHAHDPGAFITMGPGAGVELCLWSAGPRAVTSEAVPLSGWEPASLLPVRSSLVERVAQPM